MKNGLTEIIILQDNNAPVPHFGKKANKCVKEFFGSMENTEGEIRITYATFGGGYKMITDNTPVEKVKIGAKDYHHANGARDVFDSAGRTIIEKGKAYSMSDQSEHPENVIFVLTSFGRDNASKYYTYTQIREMIRHQSEVYNWRFFCLTNEPFLTKQLGISDGSVIWFDEQTENSCSNAMNELSNRIKDLIRIPENV